MTEGDGKQELRVKRWELNALFLDAILAGALVMAAIFAGAPRLLEGYFAIPQPAWVGLAFFGLFWAIYPALNVYSRSKQGRDLPAGRMLLMSAVAGVVAALLFAVLR